MGQPTDRKGRAPSYIPTRWPCTSSADVQTLFASYWLVLVRQLREQGNWSRCPSRNASSLEAAISHKVSLRYLLRHHKRRIRE